MTGFRTKLLIFGLLATTFLFYSYILYQSDKPEPEHANKLAQEGKILWQQKNCQACHQLYGLGGHLGPDLTNVSGRRPEAYIQAILKVGTPVMPNFHLTKKEINELIEFFKYTNTTGIADPKTFKQHLDGTISQ
jgi:nitric oxide reductase subunit C